MRSRKVSQFLHNIVPSSFIKAYHSYKANRNFYFEVQVAEHCNLNCVGCTHFSSIAEEGFIDLGVYERDIKRMAELFGSDYPFVVRLMGGEPLLHPELEELFVITRRVLPKAEIWVVTNGILLPSRPVKFWQSCKDNNIKIYISKYPVNINYTAIDAKVSEYGLALVDFREEKTVDFHHNVLDLEGKCDAEHSFKNCSLANSCHNLCKGKLYTCSVAAHIHHLKKYFDLDIELSEQNGIDIFKVNSSKEIIDLMNKPIPLCRYCDIDAWYPVEWKVSEKKLEEWT